MSECHEGKLSLRNGAIRNRTTGWADWTLPLPYVQEVPRRRLCLDRLGQLRSFQMAQGSRTGVVVWIFARQAASFLFRMRVASGRGTRRPTAAKFFAWRLSTMIRVRGRSCTFGPPTMFRGCDMAKPFRPIPNGHQAINGWSIVSGPCRFSSRLAEPQGEPR